MKVINKAIDYTIKIYESDFYKLERLPANSMYFSPRITNKHINNLNESFINLINNIDSREDIINLFKISESNKKLNKTDLKINTISYSPYYLCNNLLNESCNNCNICYGAKNERFKKIIESRLKNYILFNMLIYIKDQDYLLYKYILFNMLKNNKKLLTDIIRINQQSDIKNNDILYIFNDILLTIKKYFNKNTIFYTYSKTKNLNFKGLSSDFLINKSISLITDYKELLKYKDCTNIFITIDKDITINQLNDLNINYYICRGSCGSCKNCFKKNNHITLCYKH